MAHDAPLDALILATLLASCAPVAPAVAPDALPLRLCLDGGPLRGAADAAEQWRRALAQWRDLRVASHSCDLTLHVTPRPGWEGDHVGGRASAIGGREAWVYSAREDHALHELGHLLGARHVPVGLMAPHGGDCIDWTTLAMVATWHGLDATTLSPTCE